MEHQRRARTVAARAPPVVGDGPAGVPCAGQKQSKLRPFVKLARTLRARRDGILAAIRLGLSNGRMEGLNSKVRLLSHRSFGFHGPQPLIALIYLCCTGLIIDPPLR